ncbi:MAG: ATP-grasp domain-containing protein [Acutalibacteraceae bacterium]|nr:ATP-grasp domain-containing protein [Acutalibacteraceae bacterium]
MSKKRIMILGAGRGQVELIKASERLGYEAIVASIKGNYPGFEYANKVAYVDITSERDVLQAAKEYSIDGIATSCMDTAIATLGYVCDECSLTGLSRSAAKMSGDKLIMKRAFIENGVNTAKYMRVNSENELEAVIEKLQLPLIVKAVDLQGSRGINIVHTEESLLDAYKRTMAETGKDFCIIEEFIDGYEFGAQAFVYNGEVLYVLPSGDITYTGVTKVPVGHYMPLEVENDILQQIEENVKKAIKAIGLDNCAVNVDMIIKDGKIYIIELTGRVGANCLAELSSIYYGIDVYTMIAMTAMGEDVKKYFEENKKAPTACYAKMLMSDKTGVLKSIKNNNAPNPDIAEVTFFVQEGDTVNKFTNSRDCIGQIIVKGEDITTCEKLIDEVIANLEIEIEE